MADMKTLHAAEAALDFYQGCNRVAFLATCEGKFPRVRPMSPLAIERDVIWLAGRSESAKMGQMAQDPFVELVFMKDDYSHLRVRGTATFIDDPAVKRRLWDRNAEVQRYFRSPDAPEYAVLKVTITEALLMPANSMEYQRLEP